MTEFGINTSKFYLQDTESPCRATELSTHSLCVFYIFWAITLGCFGDLLNCSHLQALEKEPLKRGVMAYLNVGG